MLTGSYWLPSPTICGSVGRDIVYIGPVIGVKLAMADQRGPSFDSADLATLASDVRVSALISNKPGIITVHTGVNPDGLDLIFEVVKTTQSGRTYLSRPISTEKIQGPGPGP